MMRKKEIGLTEFRKVLFFNNHHFEMINFKNIKLCQ